MRSSHQRCHSSDRHPSFLAAMHIGLSFPLSSGDAPSFSQLIGSPVFGPDGDLVAGCHRCILSSDLCSCVTNPLLMLLRALTTMSCRWLISADTLLQHLKMCFHSLSSMTGSTTISFLSSFCQALFFRQLRGRFHIFPMTLTVFWLQFKASMSRF